ncbi:phospholipid/glycerol acyltransferase [Artemisia annua]|uniref:Phospholipid/glycerol acyltransferase n=1 Tax=Artemisia annua TaxID=35608 RepID=A0A2U1Q414_ARTAN|nr:phospholipid/glycerol acyltransferase [Artemisia annua]
MGRGTLPWSQKILFLVSLMTLLPLRVVFGFFRGCCFLFSGFIGLRRRIGIPRLMIVNPTTRSSSQPQSSHNHDDPNLEHGLINDETSTSEQEQEQEPESLDNKYAPFARHDMYGIMGRGTLPWSQKILFLVSLMTLLPLRVVFGTLVVCVYYLICKCCTLFLAPKKESEQEDYGHMGGWRRKVVFWFGRVLSRLLLFVFGFYWIKETYRNSPVNDSESDNERSVGKLPLVGLISKCLGCVYVQRESKSPDFKGVSGVVNDRINESLQDKSAPMMMLFPEGTTTNGDYILPFKTGAFLSKAPVLPVILRYPYQKFSPAWDTISGTRHVLLLLCQFVNRITVTRLPLYYPSQEEKDNPKLYAENVRRLMAREGNLKLSDIGLPEKRVYHAAIHESRLIGIENKDGDDNDHSLSPARDKSEIVVAACFLKNDNLRNVMSKIYRFIVLLVGKKDGKKKETQYASVL